MSRLKFGVSLIAAFAAGLAFFAFLSLSASPSKAPDGYACSEGEAPSSQGGAQGGVLERVRAGLSDRPQRISILDFPAAADMPATGAAMRPRRALSVAALATPSTGLLSHIAGGIGEARAQSPAAVVYGVRLSLGIAASEDELLASFAKGGDEGGADIVAISLERLVARLPDAMQGRPQVFALLSYSRGAMRLVTLDGGSDVSALGDGDIAYAPRDGGRYFLTWRLLKEGHDLRSVSWREEATSSDALKALHADKAKAALVSVLALEAEGSSVGDRQASSSPAAEEQDEEGDALECADSAKADAPSPQASQPGGTGADAPSPSSSAEAAAPSTNGRGDALPGRPASQRAKRGTLRDIASTADAPLLSPIVLVARGDFAARYPEMLRRVVRAVVTEGAIASDTPIPVFRRIQELHPYLGDNEALEALKSEPAATLAENKAFFGITRSAVQISFPQLFRSMARVLRSEGLLRGDVHVASPESLFNATALSSLTEKSVANARAMSRAARQKGRIAEAPAPVEPPTDDEVRDDGDDGASGPASSDEPVSSSSQDRDAEKGEAAGTSPAADPSPGANGGGPAPAPAGSGAAVDGDRCE